MLPDVLHQNIFFNIFDESIILSSSLKEEDIVNQINIISELKKNEINFVDKGYSSIFKDLKIIDFAFSHGFIVNLITNNKKIFDNERMVDLYCNGKINQVGFLITNFSELTKINEIKYTIIKNKLIENVKKINDNLSPYFEESLFKSYSLRRLVNRIKIMVDMSEVDFLEIKDFFGKIIDKKFENHFVLAFYKSNFEEHYFDLLMRMKKILNLFLIKYSDHVDFNKTMKNIGKNKSVEKTHFSISFLINDHLGSNKNLRDLTCTLRNCLNIMKIPSEVIISNIKL